MRSPFMPQQHRRELPVLAGFSITLAQALCTVTLCALSRWYAIARLSSTACVALEVKTVRNLRSAITEHFDNDAHDADSSNNFLQRKARERALCPSSSNVRLLPSNLFPPSSAPRSWDWICASRCRRSRSARFTTPSSAITCCASAISIWIRTQQIAFTEQFGTLERHIASNRGMVNPLVHIVTNLGADGKPSGKVASTHGIPTSRSAPSPRSRLFCTRW